MRNAIQWNHLNGDISLRHSLNDGMVSLSRAKVSHHARAFPGFPEYFYFSPILASYADALWARHAIFLRHERLLKRRG